MEGSVGFNGTINGEIEYGGGSGVTPHVTATASVDANTGTPTVTVVRSGPDSAPNFDFEFQNLKGEKGDTGAQGIQGIPGPAGSPGSQGPRGFTGDTGATGPQGPAGDSPVVSASATVDSAIGTPSVSVTKTGPQLSPNFAFEFHNLKGATGSQGIQGIQGPEGPTGPAGQGIASGGAVGQILAKSGEGDYLTEWIDPTPDALPVISDEYDDHTAYSVGDYCIYENTLYKCNTDITPYEVWDSTHWDACTVGEEIAAANSEIDTINSSLTQLTDDKFGTVVDLASYTSTKYVCVSDGFVVASCGARGDAKAIARVYDSTESNNFNIGGWGNNTYATFSCFVKKGMKLQAVTIENSGTIKFYPLNG